MECLLKVYICSARQSLKCEINCEMLVIECGLKMRLLNASDA